MKPHVQLISRFMTIFGEPRTDDPKTFIAEFSKALEGYEPTALQLAGDYIVKRHKFWPRPAEVVEAVEGVLRERSAKKPYQPPPDDLPPPTPEAKARTRALLQHALQTIEANRTGEEPPPAPVFPDRAAFQSMQRYSQNRALHQQAITKRMIGERDE